ncbi:hypothetical protein ACRC6Q_09595 [Planococcus sp. SE5232]|uniref:hypothetical protein n=1 Tax=unclassified Planococcus (in: firmicutes) TaxID=2662419 RepID=UPI001CBFE54D|nr:hypothetical protein [Planococcus sp. 4-30]
MEDHPKKETNTPKEITILTVLNSYGVFLFLGLLAAIFVHGIEYKTEFLLFILVSGIFYFLLLNLYFRGDLWRRVVYGAMCVIASFSLFMVFYLQVQQ